MCTLLRGNSDITRENTAEEIATTQAAMLYCFLGDEAVFEIGAFQDHVIDCPFMRLQLWGERCLAGGGGECGSSGCGGWWMLLRDEIPWVQLT